MKISSQHTCFPVSSGFCVSKECLLELDAAIKPPGRRRLGGEDLWDPQEMWAWKKGRAQQVFCCSAKGGTGVLDLEDRRES